MIREQESIIIKTISRILIPFIQLFGLYVIMHGHTSPGGGFQGGVILGASFILLAIAYGTNEMNRRFSLKTLTIMTALGVFLYGLIGVVCMLLGANFLDYGILPIDFEPRGMGMLGIEIGVGITVMAVMVSIFRDLITFE
ncbi:MAG: Na(+)/H(+) antiporter subunit B [Myxococcota bacterium]|nr:Na(+)/H(+) antiporter subunit B [Myxococcota bacterium]